MIGSFEGVVGNKEAMDTMPAANAVAWLGPP
jgi:hypothetical protein